MLPLLADTFIFFSGVPSTELAAARQSKARVGKEPVSLPNTIVANTKTHRDFKYNCCKYKETQRFQIELLQIQTHRDTKYKRDNCKETQNLQIQLLQMPRHNKKHAQSTSSALFENIKQQEWQRPRESSILSQAQQITIPNGIHFKMNQQNWCFQRGRTVQAQQMHLVPKQAKDSTAAPLIICRVRHLRPDRC